MTATGPSGDKSELDEIIVRSGLAEFTRDIRLGKFERSYDVAKRTINILNNMIKKNKWPTAKDLLDTLKGVCGYIDGLGIADTASGNMTRRIMRIVRDECQNYNSSLKLQQSIDETSFEHGTNESNDNCLNIDIYKTGVNENIIEGIEQELMNEIELSAKSIAQQAIDYVQSDEIILILGKSKVIEIFLRYAGLGSKTGHRKFTVIVVELAPFYSGREMAKSLNKHGISTLIIPDSAVFAIMSRVNKVILSTHSMMANGGIKAPAGSHSIALAAKHYAVPVIVCCPMYKLTPGYLVSHDSVAFKQFSHLHAAYPEPYTPGLSSKTKTIALGEEEASTTESGNVLTELAQLSQLSTQLSQLTTTPTLTGKSKIDSTSDTLHRTATILGAGGSVESIHSTFDYVQPELITLFVSNIGGNSPSYVYQLLNELYCKSDYLN